MKDTNTLIETCVEGGWMTEEETREVLAGKALHPETKAVLSWIEFKIAQQGDEADVKGQEPRVRDEACGARRVLKDLRTELIDMVWEGMKEQRGEKSGKVPEGV